MEGFCPWEKIGTLILESAMQYKMRWMAVGIAAIGLAGCATSGDKEKDADEKNEITVTIDQVPPAVKATLDQETAGGSVTDIDKEDHDGKMVYEADASIGGKPYEIKVAEDGTLLKKSVDDDKDEQGGGDKEKD
jgi:hypothetical protein